MEVVQVGARLRDARVARGLSLDDIASTTKVPKSMLVLLETDAFAKMPAPVFVRGFIRSYARVVGADPNPIVRAYEQRTSGLDVVMAEDPSMRPSEARSRAMANASPSEPRTRNGLSTDRKLTPLEPVSERREGSFRGGYALLAVVAIGLLIAAWLMVGGKKTPSDTSARAPGIGEPGPALHDRIDGVPSLEGSPRARAGLGGSANTTDGDDGPRVR